MGFIFIVFRPFSWKRANWKSRLTRRTDRQTENRLDSDSDESVVNDDEVVLPVVDVAEDKKDDAKTLEFRGIDFVIEQIENLPKSKFANGEVIYQKRGKRE